MAVRRRGGHRRGDRVVRVAGPGALGPRARVPTRTGCTPRTRWSRRSTSSCSSSAPCWPPCSPPASPRRPAWSSRWSPCSSAATGSSPCAAPSRRPPRSAARGRRGPCCASPGMVVLAIVFVAMGSIFGATDVSTVAFAEESGSKGSAGIILAIFALGSLISGLLYGTRVWKRPLYLRFATGMVALAVGVCFFFLVQSLVALAAVMFVAGFAIAPTLINGNALVQDLVPRERLTEGLTWVGTSLGVGVSVGSSVAGRADRRRRVARRVPRGRRLRRGSRSSPRWPRCGPCAATPASTCTTPWRPGRRRRPAAQRWRRARSRSPSSRRARSVPSTRDRRPDLARCPDRTARGRRAAHRRAVRDDVPGDPRRRRARGREDRAGRHGRAARPTSTTCCAPRRWSTVSPPSGPRCSCRRCCTRTSPGPCCRATRSWSATCRGCRGSTRASGRRRRTPGPCARSGRPERCWRRCTRSTGRPTATRAGGRRRPGPSRSRA